MWMLMEGVVLYLVLVKVFVKHNTRRYIASFTVASYGQLINWQCLKSSLYCRYSISIHGSSCSSWLSGQH